MYLGKGILFACFSLVVSSRNLNVTQIVGARISQYRSNVIRLYRICADVLSVTGSLIKSLLRLTPSIWMLCIASFNYTYCFYATTFAKKYLLDPIKPNSSNMLANMANAPCLSYCINHQQYRLISWNHI